MKRSDMVNIIEYYGLPVEVLQKAGIDSLKLAENLLKLIEENGMTPPCVSEEDAQAILHTYYAGYSLHQWDEDLEKDEKVMEAKRKREERKNLSPAERVSRVRDSAKRRSER